MKTHINGVSTPHDFSFDMLRKEYPDKCATDVCTAILDHSAPFLFVWGHDNHYAAQLKRAIMNYYSLQGKESLDYMMNEWIETLLQMTRNDAIECAYTLWRSELPLIIDEFESACGKERTQETLFQILKYRYEKELPTFLFSFHSLSDCCLEKKLSDLLNYAESVGIDDNDELSVARQQGPDF